MLLVGLRCIVFGIVDCRLYIVPKACRLLGTFSFCRVNV